MVAEILLDKYKIKPTHSTDEICLLARMFPENMRLFAAFIEGQMYAGIIVFQHTQVAHTQYIATTKTVRDCGALDLIASTLLDEFYKAIAYFDFGISTEESGVILNEGLLAQKEMFGARAIAHDPYEIMFD